MAIFDMRQESKKRNYRQRAKINWKEAWMNKKELKNIISDSRIERMHDGIKRMKESEWEKNLSKRVDNKYGKKEENK